MTTNGIGNQPPSVLVTLTSDAQLTAELGGDVNAQAAALMLKHGHEKRTQTRELRGVQETRLQDFEQQQVNKMREQATQMLIANQRRAWGMIVSGGLGVAAGAVTMGSAAAAGRAASSEAAAKAATSAEQTASAARTAEEATRAAQTARGVALSLDGGGSVSRGVMDLTAADAEKDAADAEAASVAAEHKASAAKRRIDDLKDEEQGARELIRTALDFLKNVREGQGAVDRATIAQRV